MKNNTHIYGVEEKPSAGVSNRNLGRGLKLMSKFRNEHNRSIERDLFEDISLRPEHIIYTLSRNDTKYPSLYLLYIQEEDLTEFEFATKYFESYQHWKSITQKFWMAQHIAEWREELELKIKARNLKSLINKAESDSSVAKYLLDNKWIEDAQNNNQGTNLRGRPSKQEIKNHLRLITEQEKMIEDDIERMKA